MPKPDGKRRLFGLLREYQKCTHCGGKGIEPTPWGKLPPPPPKR
jgi:hypothetical protein